jgi:hypothetical protein
MSRTALTLTASQIMSAGYILPTSLHSKSICQHGSAQFACALR